MALLFEAGERDYVDSVRTRVDIFLTSALNHTLSNLSAKIDGKICGKLTVTLHIAQSQ